MNARQRIALLASVFLFGFGACAFAAEPPKMPGKIYVQTADGCGMMFAEDPGFTPEILGYFKEEYWLGECTHGLANGLGYIFRPSHVLGFVQMAYMKFGEEVSLHASVSPESGQLSSLDFGPGYTYSLIDAEGASASFVSVPLDWSVDRPHALPLFADAPPATGRPVASSIVSLFGAAEAQEPALGGGRFSLVEGLSSGVPQRSVDISVEKRSCLLAGKKVRGCHYTYDNFDVFGVLVKTRVAGKDQERFTLCPDPKTLTGCGSVWRTVASPHLDSIAAFVKRTRSAMATEQESLAGQSAEAEAALPSAWKAHWRSNPVDRSASLMALKCAEAADFRPGSLDNAYFIKRKYGQPPCRDAVTAGLVIEQADAYIALDARERSDLAAQQAAEARARARRDQANAEAWSGFFNTTGAMLNSQLQIQQQRIDQTNAQIAASNSAPAPVYQPYGQPAASSPQAYDASKVQTRAIHKPELDAGSCVKLAQLANGDPLSSFGSQVFSNQCGQTVEVFWCKVGDECERGAGGSTTLGAGRSWPVTSGQYRYGACLGANSGALVRDAGGVHTGRYACTGP